MAVAIDAEFARNRRERGAERDIRLQGKCVTFVAVGRLNANDQSVIRSRLPLPEK